MRRCAVRSTADGGKAVQGYISVLRSDMINKNNKERNMKYAEIK